MKKMWKCFVKYRDTGPNGEDWEEILCLEETPEQCIEHFNETLRPWERPRELVAALPMKAKCHSWEKFSLVTEAGGYDIYKCKICGAMGKRYGLQQIVIPDKKSQQWCKSK